MPKSDPLQDAKRIIEATKNKYSDHETWINHNGMGILVNRYEGMDVSEIPTAINPITIVWVGIGAIAIAVLASVLPALRAARLHPVEALRYE